MIPFTEMSTSPNHIFRSAVCGLAAVLLSVNCASYAEQTDTPIDRAKPIFRRCEELVKSLYPKAKFCASPTALHFEYNVKKQTSFYSSSNRVVAAPEADGILGDVTLKAGKFKDTLLSERNEGYHSVLVLAPYSRRMDAYLLAQLSFPPDLDPEFKDEFKSLINSFNSGEQSVIGAASGDGSSGAGATTTGSTTTGRSTTNTQGQASDSDWPGESDTSASQPSGSSSSNPSRGDTSSGGFRATIAMGKLPVGEKTDHPITTLDEVLPLDLPMDFPAAPATTVPKEVLKVRVTESVDISAEVAKKYKKSKTSVIYEAANNAMKKGDYEVASKLYELLCARSPKEAKYFYGAGMAYRGQGDQYSAFSNFVIAWHLGQGPVFEKMAESMVKDLQVRLDDTFKLTYGFQASDPEAVLNAGARCWKAGLEKQSWQLFVYALKTNLRCMLESLPMIWVRCVSTGAG
ncbi:MAG: hypothetical protein K2Z81_28150 [Cyanobacteria bacterium]|nr:hypothetical protein [Cyanobacteriota bacterium]